MPESDQTLPVLPVLEYANPKGGQPANGRLKVEYRGSELTITDPKSAQTSPGLIRGVGGILIILGTTIAVFEGGLLIQGGEGDLAHFAAAIAAVICGGIAFFRAGPLKQQPRIVRTDAGMIRTSGCPDHDCMSGRFKPRQFLMKRASTDLRTMTNLYSVQIRYPLVTLNLLPALSRDEAVWVMDLLHKAIGKSCS